MNPDNQINLYQTPDGKIQLEVALERDTVWLNQRQMWELFDKDVRTINEHIRNIYADDELDTAATIRKSRIVQQEGARQVTREVEHYNLDVIISVGYRVKSQRGVQFRIWATNVLRQHLVQGYTLHKARFEKNATELEQALSLIRKAAQSPELTRGEAKRHAEN